MWSEIVGDTFRAWISVSDSQGSPRIGLVAGDFTVSVRSPDDSAVSNPAVTESTTGGLYYFDIPGAFLTTNGTGQYGVVGVISATGPKLKGVFSKVLDVTTEDLDSLGSSITAVAVDVSDIKKLNFNRLEVDITGQQLVLYDDNGTTILQRWTLATNGGELVATAVGVQTKRGVPQL